MHTKILMGLSILAVFGLCFGTGIFFMAAYAADPWTGDITINADGTVSPSDAPLERKENEYKLTDDIDGKLVVLRSNIGVNGMGYTITGDWSDYGIYLDTVNGVTVKNFYVDYTYMGIRLDSSCGCTIKDNTVTNTYLQGIALWYESCDNTVKDNYLTGNYAGITMIYDSDENVVKDNMVISNNYGIDTYRSDDNMVKDNTINYQTRWGISFRYSGNNIAKGNFIDGGLYYGITIYYGAGGHLVCNNVIKNIVYLGGQFGAGVYIESESNIMVRDNELYNNFIGIGAWWADGNTIKHNYITESIAPAIYLDSSTGHLVDSNEIVDNCYGVYFWNSDETLEMDNLIVNNLIQDNDYGFYTDDVTIIIGGTTYTAYDCGGNMIHHNDIVDNDVQIYEGFDNIWDDGKGEGNYWSDYEGEDTDHDGIGDTDLPHNGVDYHPLMDPYY
ncbi:MAG: right-handed parallel beta-helix repeat-containing protein [Candidatus Thermoplasmatota archaeon]|nr:right-handed parallel beta-helix repeat-containing protein [Candidatus Thermoplasmatota archaeon]